MGNARRSGARLRELLAFGRTWTAMVRWRAWTRLLTGDRPDPPHHGHRSDQAGIHCSPGALRGTWPSSPRPRPHD